MRHSPFGFDSEPELLSREGFTSEVYQFRNENKKFVYKEVGLPHRLTSNPETNRSSLEQIAAEANKHYKILKKYLDDFIADTMFIIGHDWEGKPKIYISQEFIDGNRLDSDSNILAAEYRKLLENVNRLFSFYFPNKYEAAGGLDQAVRHCLEIIASSGVSPTAITECHNLVIRLAALVKSDDFLGLSAEEQRNLLVDFHYKKNVFINHDNHLIIVDW